MKSIAQRIVDALFTSVRDIDVVFEFQSYTPEEKSQLEQDCRKIDGRYRELKRTNGFAESIRQSRLEFVQALIGEPIAASDLVKRLRGIYTVPISDGCGPLDGKSEFTRTFKTPLIQHEAAARIEALEKQVASILGSPTLSLASKLASERNSIIEAQSQEINSLKQLIHHIYIHSAYKDCGFIQMDTPQRKLFVSLLKQVGMNECAERLKEFIAE